MYVSLNWLKDFVDLPEGVSPEQLAKTLTVKTAETEGISKGNKLLDGVIAAFVEEIKSHPNADKLRIARILIGTEKREVVCGGANLHEGMYVAYAPSGCRVKWHGEGDPVVLEKTKIRGVESDGMICASEEIGLEKPASEGPEDILDLSSIKPTPGSLLREILGLDDTIIEFDNKALTHRPDLWGIYGIAREISAIYKTKFKALKPTPKIPTKGDGIKVIVEDFNLCPRYCGVIIKNVKVQESPDWMKKRLQAVGHKSYNNIVDVTNYISAELGQPLHAFDKRLIDKGIVVRTARKGEKITTLDGEERKLTEEMLLICDDKKPLAVAGIMGGMESGIKDDTTEIVIESATFYGGNIRKTSTALGLRTESVQRFEKQLDPNLSLFAMLRAIELILEVSPGSEVAGPINDQHKFDEKLKTVKLSIKKTASKIGVEIRKKEIEDILKRLHFPIADDENEDLVLVTIPSFRAQKDVNTESDLVEEIARIYGYDEIPAILPELPTKLPLPNNERTNEHSLRELLSSHLNFNEVLTYSFYSKNDFEQCGIKEEGHILIENYLSEDQTHMRKSLIPNLLNKTVLNAKYADNFNIFEIGKTYKDIGEYFPLEEKWVVGIIAEKDKKSASKTFYSAKGAVEQILETEKIPFYKLVKGSELAYAHPTKSATLLTQKGETLGSIYCLHPLVAKKYDLENHSVSIFELNLSLINKIEKRTIKFKEISKFPSIEFDVSVIIAETTEIAGIEKAIEKSDKHLIQNVRLFDFYKGPNIETDKKAVAFKITLASHDRTLSDTDMQGVQKKVFENLKQLGGSIRGT